jgi:hypothetical protein
MNNTTKKIIYVIKDDGNNHYDESIVSLHETKESAELSMATLESANTMRRFWIEEIDLFYLGKSNDELAQKLKIARKQRDELLRYNEEFRNEALICADCDAISKGKYDQAIKQRDRMAEAMRQMWPFIEEDNYQNCNTPAFNAAILKYKEALQSLTPNSQAQPPKVG